MNLDFVFTSGSVTRGHPDKLCDRISDAVVDRFLMQDPSTRVEAECAVSGGVLFLASRCLSDASVDLATTARDMVAEVGYRSGEFNAKDCAVMISQFEYRKSNLPRVHVNTLSEEELTRITADHQVTLFGYACRQSHTLIPLPLALAHALARRIDQVIEQDTLPYLAPDCQVQVGVNYRDRSPVGIHSVTVIAAQREPESPSQRQMRDDLMQAVVEPVLSDSVPASDGDTRLVINPEGPVVGGGPMDHSGLTGRKTGMDTYGEYARHSGTALSGKDPLRIERIGTYAARYAAKNVVAAGLAEECEIQLSYAMGLAEPIGLRAYTFGSGRFDDGALTARVRTAFDFRPGSICRDFGLQGLPADRNGFFKQLAAYGHVGRDDCELPWERLDRLVRLRD